MQSYTIQLAENAKPQLAPGEVLQLPTPHKPYVLKIVLPGTSEVLNNANSLFCNYPKKGKEFERRAFQEFPLSAPLSGNCIVEFEITHSGTFTVSIGQGENAVDFDFYIQPPFKLGNQHIDANGLCVQTILSKLVDSEGSVRSKEWKKVLESVAAKNYNMIHFVPLQPHGESGSPFSITDQLSWDKHSFPNGEEDVDYLVSELERLNILGLTDMVLNHTASDSKWLGEHLDAGYSAETAPHLQAAIELDTALLGVHDLIISNHKDLDKLDDVVKSCVETIKLWEFYIVDVDQAVATVESHPFQGTPSSDLPSKLEELAQLLPVKYENELGPRFHRRVDTSLLAEYTSGSEFSAKQIVDQVNSRFYQEYNDDVGTAIKAIKDRQRYLRLDEDGPKLGEKADPVIETYFNRNYGTPLACNGWEWGGNPLVDHAGPKSKAYIRRELIVWGDCTKLRYGERKEDSPYLWDRMAKYARLMAKYFAGVRIDNAHSTPLHVGEYLIDEARKVRPNLYVVAELFSGSQEMDKLYVEKLGLSSLLREAIMPGNPKDLSTVIHSNGGLPIGSLIDEGPLRGKHTHAWLMEVTHDNESMADKRTVEDTLSTAGLVAMCQVTSGSTFGSDECYAHALNVVTEERPYETGGGISEAKGYLNTLHQEMAHKNMFESYTDLKGQYITVHRVNPETGEGIFLAARTKFHPDSDETCPPVKLEASKAEFDKGWSITVKDNDVEDNDASDSAVESKKRIPRIPVELKLLSPIEPEVGENGSTIHLPPSTEFPQGSIAIWKTSRIFDADKIEHLVREDAEESVADLSLLDINVLMYHAEGEEKASTDWKRGVYTVPDMGPLVYAGLQGWESHLENVVKEQNLGHPICANIRNGLWAFEYLIERLPKGNGEFEKVIEYLKTRLEACKKVPSFLRPRYFVATVQKLYEATAKRALKLLHVDPDSASTFYQLLTLTSVQYIAKLPNCSLFPDRIVPTMAAGLPHFSEGVMRCWGRDMFLSIGGLLILLGRYDEAENHILGFGATLKYGLIPNLLDSGRNPRYNARDAAWFFVEGIQQYCEHRNSYEFLNAKVRRRFPLDDSYTDEPTDHESSVGELVYEVLSRHAGGIKFREHNAGPSIDMHMSDNGFNQKIWVDWSNGIIFGGNQDNCGTWMDKMGESEQAKSEGVPGTPRDGAAIEITGLLKSCLRWVNKLRREKKYDFPSSVETQDGKDVSLEDWEKLLQENFERCYYIPEEGEKEYENYDVDETVINRRGIYKDTYRSGKNYEDYELRPNFTVAVNAAPELFDVNKVSNALEIADKALRGPVGMATLDPSDWNYRPYYLNSIDSTDFATAKGRNYHQGPEWVWQFGTFLQAYIQTMKRQNKSEHEILCAVRSRIQGNVSWIKDSEWKGLTELTQKDGELCGDSSPTQAWSSARLIEALYSVGV